jgi:hypothetical protein
MKPQDWFGLGVRFAGLWCVVQSAMNLMYFLDIWLGLSRLREPSYLTSDKPAGYLLYAVGYAALGLYFLFRTEHLTKRTFHTAEPSEPRTETTQDQSPPPADQKLEEESTSP